MKLSEILTLVGAGYTRQEIDEMAAQEAGEPEPAPAAPAAPDPEPAAAPPAAEPQRDPELLEAIKSLTAAVQHRNVINSAQPASTEAGNALADADKILTKFCNT